MMIKALSFLAVTASSFQVQLVRPRLSTGLDAIGIFFGTSTGNTEAVANFISAKFGDDASDPIDIDGMKGKLSDEFAKYDALIVGTPTWNTGADTERSGTGWDEVYYGEMADLNLEGKPVAVFGLGDSVSYAENYCDGLGELHDVFAGLGCKMLGYVSVEGYEHEESKSQRGDVFCGLALDAVNFEELTEGRVESWIEQLKEEGILEATGSAFMGSSAPAAAVALTTQSFSIEDDIVAQLQRENAELRRQLQESSGTKSASFGNNRFSPHYNSVTGRTMWTSADGRSCYFTQGSP